MLLSLAAIYASVPSLDIRPYAVSILFFIICLRMLIGEDTHQRRIALKLGWLFLCSAIWVNIHGSFLIGLIASLTFMLTALIAKRHELIQWLHGRERISAKTLSHMLAPLAMLIGGLCNPFGVRAITYPFTYWLTETKHATKIVAEWLPPDFKLPFDYAFLMLLCLCIILPAISHVRTDARVRLNSLSLLCAVLAAMALISRRNICLFATCSVLFIAQTLPSAFQIGILSKPFMRSWHTITIISLATILVFLRSALMALRHPLREELFPYGAVEFMKANSLPTPIFNPYHWGGFLIAAFDGRVKVFIDGRADIYSAQFLKRYHDAQNGLHGWDDFLDEHAVKTAIVDVATPLYELLRQSQKWQMLYRDITGAVFVRVSREAIPLLKRAQNDELKYPKNAWAYFYRGMMCAERKQYERAIMHWKEALSLKPDMAEAAINLGCAYARLKRWKDAKWAFETAIRLLGKDSPQYLHRYLREAKKHAGE